MTSSSEVPGFYKKKPTERLDYVKKFGKLSNEEAEAIGGYGALGEETANRMIENVVGTFPLPLGIAANFMINEKEYINEFRTTKINHQYKKITFQYLFY